VPRLVNAVLMALGFAMALGQAHADTVSCGGTVTIGEGATAIATTVPNKSVGGTCMNALIVDTVAEGASYDNHAEFVVDVTKLSFDWAGRGLINLRELAQLIGAAARSDVGKTITVRVSPSTTSMATCSRRAHSV
jgi:hypothetical protein